MIGNLQQFDTIWALTGGGPVRATTVLSVEVYRRAFERWDIGMAATVGVLWVATMLPPAYFYLRADDEGVRLMLDLSTWPAKAIFAAFALADRVLPVLSGLLAGRLVPQARRGTLRRCADALPARL